MVIITLYAALPLLRQAAIFWELSYHSYMLRRRITFLLAKPNEYKLTF